MATRGDGARHGIRSRLGMALRLTAAGAIGIAATLAVIGEAGASQKLTTNIGNGGGGKIAKEANAVAKKHLIGPKGSGLTRGITSSSITVGCVYTAADYQGYQQGIQARFNQANKKGIDGRKLKLLPCKDDASNVQTNVQDNQQLVNQSQVFSVLSLSEMELPGSTTFLNNNQVPFFGWGFNPGFCGTRWGFGWNGCLSGNSIKMPIEAIAGNLAEAAVKASGLKPSQVRLANQAENDASGKIDAAQTGAIFKAIGSKVVYNKTDYPASSSGVDNTPYVQAIMASKPNIVYLSTNFADVAPLAASLKAAGYKGMVLDFVNYIPGLLQSSSQLASALKNEYINTQVVPYEQNTPYIKTIEKSFSSAGKVKLVTLGAFMGYAEADMLVQMLQKVGKNLNTKTFDQAINDKGFTAFNSGPSGGPGKLIWPAGHYLPADCAAVTQVTGTKYKVVEPFSCYQSFKVG